MAKVKQLMYGDKLITEDELCKLMAHLEIKKIGIDKNVQLIKVNSDTFQTPEDYRQSLINAVSKIYFHNSNPKNHSPNLRYLYTLTNAKLESML